MIPFGSWVALDTLGIVVQLGFAALFLSRFHGSRPARALLLSLLVMLIFPIGLQPMGISRAAEPMSIPRNWFWMAKVGGVGLGDLFISAMLAYSFLGRKLSKEAATMIGLFAVIVVAGFVGMTWAPRGAELKGALNSVRGMICVLIAFNASGYAGSLELRGAFVRHLAIQMLMSVALMVLLEPDYRPFRYWTNALFHSQAFAVVGGLCLIELFTKRRKPLTLTAILFIGAILPCLGAVKANLLLFAGSLPLLLFFRNGTLGRSEKTIVNSFGILFAMLPFLSAVGGAALGVKAMITRLDQTANTVLTANEMGTKGLLFGIGWNQWYRQYVPMLEMDYGAYSLEEMQTPGWKRSVQISPVSVFRDAGLVGVGLVLVIAYRGGRRAYSSTGYFLGGNLVASILCAGTLTNIPSGLPELALFYPLFVWNSHGPPGTVVRGEA